MSGFIRFPYVGNTLTKTPKCDMPKTYNLHLEYNLPNKSNRCFSFIDFMSGFKGYYQAYVETVNKKIFVNILFGSVYTEANLVNF